MNPGYQAVYTKNRVSITQISPQVYFRKGDLMERGQCNSIYLLGDDFVSVVDVPTAEAAGEMEEECANLFRKPIQNIILTHGHEDHAGGLAAFKGKPVQILCSHKLFARLPFNIAGNVIGIFSRAEVLLGGVKAHLFTFEDTAHTPEDLLIRLPEEGLLCTGDAVVELDLLHFHEADSERWVFHLERLAAYLKDTILPGHGDPLSSSHMAAASRHISLLRKAAKACIKAMPDGNPRDLGREGLDRAVAQYFSAKTAESLKITESAPEGAFRELRMVLRELLRKNLQ